MRNDIPYLEFLILPSSFPVAADVGQQLPYKECNSVCDGKMNEKCYCCEIVEKL